MRGIETLVDGLDHPEGVAWDGRARVLYAGGEAGQLYRVELEGRRFQEVARAPGSVLGLAIDRRGRLVLCCSEAGVYAWDGSELRAVLTDVVFANYPAFAPDGTLFVSDSGGWRRNDGRVLRIALDGTADTFSRAVPHFTNGLVVTPDGRQLWVAESFEPNVSRVDLETGEAEVVVRLAGTVPDGLAPTEDGGLVISCYRPDRIYHLAPDGALSIVAEDPQGTALAAPTNVCFAGEELGRLVAANLGRRHLALVDAGLRGVPLHAPKQWAIDALVSV
jgi:sugar lactone lactonase YvrE